MSKKLNLVAKILGLLEDPGYHPLSHKELAAKLNLKQSERKLLNSKLNDLELAGKIARVRRDRWVLAGEVELVTGVIHFHQKGFAFLIPEDHSPDVFISAEDTSVAMHQDLVTARLSIPARRKSDRRSRATEAESRRDGRVIRILKRRREQLVGTLQRYGQFWVVAPDDPRCIQNIYVPEPGREGGVKASVGDKVVVQLLEWKSRHINPEGVLLERLGRAGEPGVDILSVIRKHDLPTEFPSEALSELARYQNAEGDARVPRGRLDLRDEFIITIDPDTARDFDDAISVKKLSDNRWEVGVHIADVAHYVRPGSALDKEARRRGNSVYLVNQVIPMLPEELSNGLCSLRPNVDRLTYSVIAVLDAEANLLKSKVVKTVIHSRHRLTYGEALRRLQRKPVEELDRFLHNAWAIASKWRKARFSKGSLDLEMPEVEVKCDKYGVPLDIVKVEHDISHQLIEEFMLFANETVAARLKQAGEPALYRVHEKPDPEKLKEYRQTLVLHGLRVGDLRQKKEIQKVLKKIRGIPEEHSLKVGLLKSLKRANYRPEPLGHYGLGKTNYTHFTSPIRRYPDLIVHRALEVMGKRKPRVKGDELKRLGQHFSATEQIASEAELESIRLKKLQYFTLQLEKNKKQKFSAQIMSVENFGFFVELSESLTKGLVHVSSFRNDFLRYDARTHTLISKRTQKSYRAGQMLEVAVERIDLLKQQIDFRVA